MHGAAHKFRPPAALSLWLDGAVRPQPDAAAAPVSAPSTAQRRQLVFPNSVSINGTIDTDWRYRGIHYVLVYRGQHKFACDFGAQYGLLSSESNALVMGSILLFAVVG